MQRQRSYHLKKELKGAVLGSGRWEGNEEDILLCHYIITLYCVDIILFLYHKN